MNEGPTLKHILGNILRHFGMFSKQQIYIYFVLCDLYVSLRQVENIFKQYLHESQPKSRKEMKKN